MRRYVMSVDGTNYSVIVETIAADRFRVTLAPGETYEVQVVSDEDLSQTVITPEIVPSRSMPAGYHTRIGERAPVPTTPGSASANGSNADVKAPIPGAIISVAVKPGDEVRRGQLLLTIETMKMQNPLKAARDGVVAEVCVEPGQQVAYGAVLLRWRNS